MGGNDRVLLADRDTFDRFIFVDFFFQCFSLILDNLSCLDLEAERGRSWWILRLQLLINLVQFLLISEFGSLRSSVDLLNAIIKAVFEAIHAWHAHIKVFPAVHLRVVPVLIVLAAHIVVITLFHDFV